MELKYDVREIMIHKKDKTLIQIALCTLNGQPAVVVHETANGIKLGNQINDAAYMLSLPKLTGSIVVDLKVVLKHFRAHGFKSANTITSASKGIRFS